MRPRSSKAPSRANAGGASFINREHDHDHQHLTAETGPKFRTRADAEAEIALLNEEIESLQELVKNDIELLKEQRAEIEEQLDDLPDEEGEKEFADLVAEEWKKHKPDDGDDDDEPGPGVVAEIEKFLAQENE